MADGRGVANDTLKKGIVGKPSETDSERSGGDKGEKTLNYGGGNFNRESAGLLDGVSVREDCDVSQSEPNYDYDIDPATGNATERKVGRSNNMSVSGKAGKSFDMGEF